jgi:hypothetical protein
MSTAAFIELFAIFMPGIDRALALHRKGEPFMEMLLMGICVAVFGMAIACAAFGAAVRPEKSPEELSEVKAEPVRTAAPARFFINEVSLPTPNGRTSVPIEALLLELERHVRLEQAAAESFLAEPTSALLHSKTVSPFLN